MLSRLLFVVVVAVVVVVVGDGVVCRVCVSLLTNNNNNSSNPTSWMTVMADRPGCPVRVVPAFTDGTLINYIRK